MRGRLAVAGAAVFALVVVVATATVLAIAPSQSSARVRTTIVSGPLVDQLRPDDTTLEVIPIESGPEPILPPSGTGYLEWWTRLADFVAIIRVDTRTSRLTDDRTFLVTDIEAAVLDVLKPPRANLPPLGRTPTFVERGGELIVGKQRIVGKKIGGNPLELGAEYLVFASYIGSAVYIDSPWTYEIVNRRLVTMATSPGMDDIPQTRDIDALKQKIREMFPRPRR